MNLLEKYEAEAKGLLALKQETESAYSKDMEEFTKRVIKERFPGITGLEVEFNYRHGEVGLNWAEGPSDAELQVFMDEMNKCFNFNQL